MKKLLLVFGAFLFAIPSFSQVAKDILIGGNLDLIKSDQIRYFQNAQGGFEFNYFLSRKLTGTGGVEYWTGSRQFNAIIGGRIYPVPEAFIRIRWVMGANDLSVGGGWAMPIKENWRFEAMGDVYSDGHIAIRAGFAYWFRIH